MEEAGAGGEEDGSRGEGRGQSIGCTVTRQAFAPCVAIVAAEALAAALRDCDSMAACLPHLTRLVSALQATDAELGVDLQEHFALCFDGGGPYVAPATAPPAPVLPRGDQFPHRCGAASCTPSSGSEAYRRCPIASLRRTTESSCARPSTLLSGLSARPRLQRRGTGSPSPLLAMHAQMSGCGSTEGRRMSTSSGIEAVTRKTSCRR